jgi:hypothetical protein
MGGARRTYVMKRAVLMLAVMTTASCLEPEPIAPAIAPALGGPPEGDPFEPDDPCAGQPEPPDDPTRGPLSVSGSHFYDAAGSRVWLAGTIPGCNNDEYPCGPTAGWPFISRSCINRMVNEGAGNWIHLRLGPHTRWVEDRAQFAVEAYAFGADRYDLNDFNEGFWNELTDRVAYAQRKGVYVEIDLIDAWTLEGGNGGKRSPWSHENNVNGVDLRCATNVLHQPLDDTQRTWLSEIVHRIGSYDNVIFEISNEPYDCDGHGVSPAWETEVATFVRGELARLPLPAHIIGTNVGPGSVTPIEAADYVTVHDLDRPLLGGKPTGVNEHHDLTPAEYTDELWYAFTDEGTYLHFWWGGNDNGRVSEALSVLKAFHTIVDSSRFAQFVPALHPHVTGLVGQQYVGYIADAASQSQIVIDLGPEAAKFSYRWYRPNGSPVATGLTPSVSGTYTFQAPVAEGKLILRVTRRDAGTYDDCPPPAAPTPFGPSGTLEPWDDRPTFTWSAVPDATVYTLYVIRDTPYEEVVLRQVDITGTSFTPEESLPHGVQLHWKVKGVGCEEGEYSTDLYFMIGPPCTPPQGPPTLIGPIGQLDEDENPPTFSWTAVPYAESYNLWVMDPSDEFVVHEQGVDGTSFTPWEPLPEGIELHWTVKGVNECNFGPTAGYSYFMIGLPCERPSTPITYSPIGVVNDPTPLFTWSAAANADAYTLYVFQDNPDGSETIVHGAQGVQGTSYEPPNSLPTDVTLRWKVKGESVVCGPGDYSAHTYFQIIEDGGGGAPCGDGECTPGEEDCGVCLVDCPCPAGTSCNASGSPGQCEATCGDDICVPGLEDNCSCPQDCPAECGNQVCECAESCNSCPTDCGECRCGNGTCDFHENCGNCPEDCGYC